MGPNKPKYAILHHTADSTHLAQLNKVDEWHKARFAMRSMLGYWVGYHYFIERDGSTTQTRKNDEEGAHAKGHNFESVGIALAGNFDMEEPSQAQLNALSALLDQLTAELNLAELPLHYHFDFSDTHCPGSWFRGNEWKQFIIQNKITFLKRVLLWLTNALS